MPANLKAKHLLIGLLFLALTASTAKVIHRTMGKNQRLEDARQELAVLEKTKEQLRKDIEYKKSDAFVEEIARNELNMIRDGEEVYVVKGLEESDVLGSSQEARIEGFDAPSTGEESPEPSTNYQENLYSWYKLVFD